MAISKEIINGLIKTIQNLYLSDDIPWMIGYSGGKDSTAALQLAWIAIEGLPERQRVKPIHIMNTDTLVESPVVSKWVEKSLDSMRKAAKEKKLPFVPEKLIPEYNNTFWVNLIGRGYPFPRMKYRWCTDRLKIQPVNNFIKNKIAEHGEVILVLGTRKAESSRRNQTMTNLEKKRVRELDENGMLFQELQRNDFIMQQALEQMDDYLSDFEMQYPESIEASRIFVDYVRKQTEADSSPKLYEMSDHALFQMNDLVENTLQQSVNNTKSLLANKADLKKQLDAVESYLTLDINEKDLTAIYDQIKAKEAELVEAQVEYNRLQQERSSINSTVITKSNLEMSWYTFGGEYYEVYEALVKAWCISMGLETDDETVSKYFRLNLERGISYLCGTGFIRSIDDLLHLAVK